MSSYEPRRYQQSRTLNDAIARGERSPELLDAVLRTTLAATGTEDTVDPQTRQALDEVARRHRGKPVGDPPVAKELVAAVLRDQFGMIAAAPAVWEGLISYVAQTLLGDPTASRRLECLWLRITENAR